MIQLKSPRLSIPAEAGIQSFQELLDPRWSLSQVFAFKKRKNLIRSKTASRSLSGALIFIGPSRLRDAVFNGPILNTP